MYNVPNCTIFFMNRISFAENHSLMRLTKFEPISFLILLIKVLEKCTKNLIGHSRLAFNNHESNIDC